MIVADGMRTRTNGTARVAEVARLPLHGPALTAKMAVSFHVSFHKPSCISWGVREMNAMQFATPLANDLLDHPTGDVGQSKVTAGVAIGLLLVIETKQM